MKKSISVLALAIASVLSITAYAQDSDADEGRGRSADCPYTAMNTMDNEFGAGTSANTTCIAKRHHIRTVINMSSADVNKTGRAQQLVNVQNVVQNYEGMYGMQIDKDYEIVVVGHGKGGKWLVNDAAYNAATGTTAGNPSRALIEQLIAHGIPIYMCQNTMRGNGWKSSDLIPGVREVPAGVAAVIDLGERGYVVVTP